MDVGKSGDYLKAKLDRSKEDLDDARDLFPYLAPDAP